MTYNDALDYINNLDKLHYKPQLARTKILLDKLGNPQKSLKFINITGTNGKNAIASMLLNILIKSDYKIGLFSHIDVYNIREKISINGRIISKNDFTEVITLTKKYADMVSKEIESPRKNEVLAAAALLYFCKNNCDIVILEAGITGRTDPTNAIDKSSLSIISNIAIDNTDILGNRYYDIAKDKCDIIKENSFTVSVPNQHSEVRDCLNNICAKRHSPLTIPQLEQLKIIRTGLDASEFKYHGISYRLNALGRHQILNAMTAIDSAICLDANTEFNINIDAIKAGIESTTIKNQTELINNDKILVLDSASNIEGVYSLLNVVQFIIKSIAERSNKAEWEISITAIVGMLKSGDCTNILDVILPYCKNIIVTKPTHNKALNTKNLSQAVSYYCLNPIVKDNPIDAYIAAKKTDCDIIICFGSEYMSSEIRTHLKP